MPDQILSAVTLDRLRDCWAAHLGTAPGDLFTKALQIVTHGPELVNYPGVLAFVRGGHGLVSLPPDRAEELRVRIPGQPITPKAIAEAFRDLATAVIGPAWIGYAESVAPPTETVQPLTMNDQLLIARLRSACDAQEWEHGGSAADHRGLFGIVTEANLLTLAGYVVWGGVIAHISVITHPGWRGRGLARRAVSRAAAHALEAGLIPQYRTLESNLPSMRVGAALGFVHYATSMAIRLRSVS